MYLVYLNHANGTNWRSLTSGFVTFSNEILGLYTGGTQTLYFTGSDYSSSFYPSTATSKRGPELSSGDTFTVTNSNKTFTMRCKNGLKGDFFRVVTRTTCSEPTGAGTLENPESNCGSFNPGNIWYLTNGSGGSGGTPTYFWEKSTTNSSSGFSTISGVSTVGYNPPSTITQTTWYRRGYYRCDISAAIYTPTIEKTVNDLPAVDAGIDQTVCGGDNVTLNGSGASTYTWDNGVTNNTAFTASTTTTYTVTGTDANGCQNTDPVSYTHLTLPTNREV